MVWLAALFAVTAFLYASVGFGGGSTYTALLALAGTSYHVLPVLSLSCNIVVVSGGAVHFGRTRHIRLQRWWPWIISSLPMAAFGGYIRLTETTFIGLLGIVLFITGLALLFQPNRNLTVLRYYPRWVAPVVGGILGLIAGMTGIGGGIFLAPVLHLLRWGQPREIAGMCSIFILLNSMAGLIGQLGKHDIGVLVPDLASYWLLLPAVLIGGQIGSWLGATRLSQRTLARLTSMLILYVAGRLLWQWFGMIG